MDEAECVRKAPDTPVEEISTADSQHKEHVCQKLKQRQKVTIEPAVFLISFTTTLAGGVLTNLLLVQSCEYLKFPVENCTQMDTQSGSSVEISTQPFVTKLAMCKTILEAVFSAVMSFFLGPWSDTHGRRPLIIYSVLGYSLYFLLLLCYTFLWLPPYYVLIVSLPLGATGGYITFLSACFCYVNDISENHNCTFRMAVVETMLFGGLSLGTLVSSYLYFAFPSHRYEGVFATSFGCCMCTLIYTIVFVPESIENPEERHSGLFQSVLNLKTIREISQTCFYPRPGYSRAILLLIVGAGALNLLAIEGDMSVTFLFVREMFLWTLRDFSFFADISLLFLMCGVLFGTTIFSTWLRLPHAPLACVASLVRVGSLVLAGFNASIWYLYVSSALKGLCAIVGPISRTIISEVVPKNDIGKVFVLSASIESLVPLLAAPLYTVLYNNTMTTFPGAFFLLSAGLSLLCSVIFGIVTVLNKIHAGSGFSVLEEDGTTDEDLSSLISTQSRQEQSVSEEGTSDK